MPRLLLLYGPEPVLVEELAERVAAAALAGSDPVLARELVFADESPPEALVAAARDLPLGGSGRLVVVRGLHALGARALDRWRQTLATARSGQPPWPPEGTTVLLVAPGVTRRASVLRLVPDADQVEVRPPVGRALLAWLRERAARANATLEPAAADALLALVGEDVARLAGEVDKAAVMVGPGGRITEDLVRTLTGAGRGHQLWELADALERGDRGTALRVLDALLGAREDPLAVLAHVVGYVRDLWRARSARAQGLDARRLAARLPRRRPDWAVERLLARAAAPGSDPSAALLRCFEVELRLKSGGGDPRALLTALVAELAGA